jgi:hypothetical protein
MDASDVVMAFVIGLIFGGILGGCCASTIKNDAAVVAGVAEYYLDADHNRQFRYLTNR